MLLGWRGGLLTSPGGRMTFGELLRRGGIYEYPEENSTPERWHL